MDDIDPLRPEDHLGYLLVRAADAEQRRWSAGMRAAGLTPRRFSVLAVLLDAPTVSQAELARRAFVTPQSMGELLSALERDGFVQRDGGGPGTPSRATVTPDGRAVLDAARPVVERLDAAGFAMLDPDERATLAGLLARVASVDSPTGRTR